MVFLVLGFLGSGLRPNLKNHFSDTFHTESRRLPGISLTPPEPFYVTRCGGCQRHSKSWHLPNRLSWKKRTLFSKSATFFPFCIWHIRDDANNRLTVSCSFLPENSNAKADLVYLTDRVPLGTSFWCTLFPSLLSLLCDRGVSEGELGRSRLPLHAWNCTTLLWISVLRPSIVYNLWGEMVYRHGAILLVVRRRRRHWHWRWSARRSAGTVWKRRSKRRRETRKEREKTRINNKRSSTHHGWHEDGMSARYRHIGWLVLSHAVWYAHLIVCKSAWEKWRVKCVSLHPPSITVDRHRL